MCRWFFFFFGLFVCSFVRSFFASSFFLSVSFHSEHSSECSGVVVFVWLCLLLICGSFGCVHFIVLVLAFNSLLLFATDIIVWIATKTHITHSNVDSFKSFSFLSPFLRLNCANKGNFILFFFVCERKSIPSIKRKTIFLCNHWKLKVRLISWSRKYLPNRKPFGGFVLKFSVVRQCRQTFHISHICRTDFRVVWMPFARSSFARLKSSIKASNRSAKWRTESSTIQTAFSMSNDFWWLPWISTV